MKTKTIATILGISMILGSCSGRPDSEALERGFITPPDSIKTSVYWYWISNHISKEGVIKDLQSMKEAGIDRAYIGNIGLADSESGEGPVKFYSDEWWEITHAALKTATELGIEIGIFNCPGWSQSGGPWVSPEQSMRYLASSSVTVTGGRKIEIDLPRPESRWADRFQDVRTIAYPHVKGEKLTLDGKAGHRVGNELRFSFTPANAFTLRSVSIQMSENAVDCPARIEARQGDKFVTLAEFPVTRFNPNLNVGFSPYAPVVISVPSTEATEFRVTLINPTPGSSVKDIVLSSLPTVERYPEKTLAKMYQTPLPYWHEYMWREQPDNTDTGLAIRPDDVIDISNCLDGDRLSWDAPDGEWVILRTGMLPTGVMNSPARPEATGLETDKMSREHIEAHFEAFLGEIYRRIPAEDRKCWKVVVEDSYETGGQNFTDGFIEEFQARYGYDPVPFLPVYYGTVVGNRDISDRFLWDMRRLVADKVAYDYVGGLREISHKYGLTTWLENYGHWGFPGEFLQYGGQSDEIGGEFWSEGSLGDIENRAASSCGHIYGKNRIYAESFTAGGGGYHRYPAMMKQRGDRFFTEGINSTLLHLYISQPYEDREPGVNATFSNEFNRKNTWFPHLDLFISYLKRANFMLQQGTNIADVAYFIGEDTPKMTGITDPPLPAGYQFDYINAEVIENSLSVRDGRLTLPHGTQYRLLVLPRQNTMRPELLEKIEQLIEDGAIVMGPAPEHSPSLADYPAADSTVRSIADRLWSKIDPATGYARIGKGILMNGPGIEEAMDLAGCPPDFGACSGKPLLYCHRQMKDIDIYFVSNQSDKPVSAEPVFRVSGKIPEAWSATDGKTRKLPVWTSSGDGTRVPLRLDSYESIFIVFRDRTSSDGMSGGPEDNFPEFNTEMDIDRGWTAGFDPDRQGPAGPVPIDRLYDISEDKDFNIRHYSGTITYSNSFNLDSLPDGKRVYLNLHNVVAMAKVKINGKYAGGVWTPPYRVDITDAVRAGTNGIEVEVTTTWKNRIVGDLNLPEDARRTWVAYQPWTADEPLQKTGLIGPVTIETNIY